MRAQWVCSRERRIALYKRTSINQCFPTPSSKLCQNLLCHWRDTLYLREAVHRHGQRPPKGSGINKTVETTLFVLFCCLAVVCFVVLLLFALLSCCCLLCCLAVVCFVVLLLFALLSCCCLLCCPAVVFASFRIELFKEQPCLYALYYWMPATAITGWSRNYREQFTVFNSNECWILK